MTPTVKLVSEGLGTIEAEGGFYPGPKWTSNPQHMGPWALGVPEWCTAQEAVDPNRSTYLALENRKANGSYESAWWHWEEIQGETETGKTRAHKFVKIAEAAGAGGNNPSLGEEIPVVGGIIGAGEEIVEGTVGTALDAGEFLAEMAETLLDFRKLGNLAVQAFAWFLRMLLKAIWDYVLAPLVHWAERAETFYWRNFFSTGTEKGSGFGYQLRQNAGIITIGFWAVGYAVLWSDGSNFSPVDANESMLGRAVKGVEGKIARRNLVKPSDVKSETPTKPEPKTSSVNIERVKEFSVNRKRPVTVGIPGGEDITGRNNNEQHRQGQRVPRPGQTPKQEQEQKEIVRVPEQRSKKPEKQTKTKTPETAASSGPGSASRTSSGDRTKGDGSAS